MISTKAWIDGYGKILAYNNWDLLMLSQFWQLVIVTIWEPSNTFMTKGSVHMYAVISLNRVDFLTNVTAFQIAENGPYGKLLP